MYEPIDSSLGLEQRKEDEEDVQCYRDEEPSDSMPHSNSCPPVQPQQKSASSLSATANLAYQPKKSSPVTMELKDYDYTDMSSNVSALPVATAPPTGSDQARPPSVSMAQGKSSAKNTPNSARYSGGISSINMESNESYIMMK